MCGISGILQFRESISDRELNSRIQEMIARQVHRGPDDCNFIALGDVALGHNRLAIQDLSSNGAQPMHSRSGRFSLVFNGEVYNHIELRNRVSSLKKSLVWLGRSDTESILEYFECFGILKTLQDIDGMFALALWDRKEKKLTLARDRFGEKPLYFFKDHEAVFFSSEISAIKSGIARSLSVDDESLRLLRTYGFIPEPRTIYRGVRKLRPGTYLECQVGEEGDLVPKHYWTISSVFNDSIEYKRPISALEEKVEALLDASVSSRMLSDVEVGAFLSGGVDSSLVASSAFKDTVGTCYTIGFDDAELDESGHARQVATALGLPCKTRMVTGEEITTIADQAIRKSSEPIADASLIPTFALSEFAAADVKVCLTGDGADEIFGGYTRYIAAQRISTLRQTPLVGRVIQKMVAAASSIAAANPTNLSPMRSFFRQKQLRNFIKLVGALAATDIVDFYEAVLANGQLKSQGRPPITVDSNVLKALSASGYSDPQILMFLDILQYMPSNTLQKVDRAAMAHSLETRAPFLNHRLLELAARNPISSHLRGGKGKIILRRILKKRGLDIASERGKQGFEPPVSIWLRKELSKPFSEIMDSDLSFVSVEERQKIRNMYKRHFTRGADHGQSLWNIFVTATWLDEYA